MRALFGIVVEGETEERYFKMKYFKEPTVSVNVSPGKPNDPPALARAARDMVDELKGEGDLRAGDQVWIVLDSDEWSDDQLAKVFDWVEERSGRGDRGVGLCVPQFEYWLLLHYEDAKGVGTQSEVLRRLKEYLPRYRKNMDLDFSEEEVLSAVERAKAKVPNQIRNLNELDDLVGRGSASTTVHFLVERLVDSLSEARR